MSIETTPDGRRLADSATGAVLPLSEGELRLLEFWDGRATAVELAAKALSSGLAVEAGQVEAFFSRMSRIGVLGKPPPVVPGAVVAPLGVKVATDVVPGFRGDLKLEPARGARGVIHVTDPLLGRTFTLYDFEVSIARMLNARRTAAEVLQAADRLGVPLTLASLRAFIAQLKVFHFLAASGSRTHTTWGPRKAWSDDVRDLYQQALRLARRGDRHEALSCLESLLELDPKNEDAIALNGRLSDTTGRPAIGTSFDLLHAKAPPEVAGPGMKPEYPLAQGDDPFEALAPVAEPGRQPVEPLSSGPALWPAESPLDISGELSLSQQQRRRTFWPTVLSALVLAGVLAALFFPVQAETDSGCTIELIELSVLKAPFEGVVTYDVQPGQLVSVGQVVAHMANGNTASTIAALEAKVAEANRQKARLAPESPAKIAKANKRLAQAEAQLEAARERAKGLKGSPKKATVDKAVKAKEAAVARARAAVEALTHSQAAAGAEEAIARAKQALEEARSRVESPDIVTPLVGRFFAEERPIRALNTDRREAVPKGTVVGRIVSTSLGVTLKEASVPPPGRYLVRVGSEQLEARADSARLYIDGEPTLEGKACTVRVPEGRRPWVLTLLK